MKKRYSRWCRHAGPLLTGLMIGSLPLPAWAVTIHVPGDQPTIQAGIDAASWGDIVVVACGTYYESDIQMKSGIELRSETGEASCVTIDVSGQLVGIMCNSLAESTRIVGLTITGASGNGVSLYNSDITVEACRLWRNISTGPQYNGAGVTCSHGSPSLINCRFEENSTPGAGGGFGSGQANPALIDCVFDGNFAGLGGGGAALSHGYPTLTRCSFLADSTSGWGGGINLGEATPTLTDCDFQGCWAGSGGGGLQAAECSIVLDTCLFTDNHTGSEGGGGAGFHLSYPHIDNCTFIGNSANAQGGGADFYLSYLTMGACTFSGNTAVNGSGGGMNAGNTDGSVQGCSFSGNGAGMAGGGFHNGSSLLGVTDSVFEDNSAFRGGGLSYGDAAGLVEDCTFRRNQASSNGGGMNTSFRNPTIRDCIFAENSTAGRGGGLSCYRSWPEVSGSLFADNMSVDPGGGVSAYVYSNPVLASCTFSGNGAVGGGGGVASTSESFVTLENCIISYSTTGVAVHCDSTSGAVFFCSDLYGNVDGDWVGCAAGQDSVGGNFSAPPIFCDPANGDYYLAANSPCADAPGCGLVGAFPVGCSPASIEGERADLAQRLILGPIVPNPFRDSAAIRYILEPSSDAASVRFDIFAVDGRLVRRLVNEPQQPGVHTARWDGKDDGGRRLPSGIYFGRLRSGDRRESIRVVLLD